MTKDRDRPMIVCDICRKRRPRRQIKVKYTYYDKPRSQGTQYDLCEECFKKVFKPVLDKQKD